MYFLIIALTLCSASASTSYNNILQDCRDESAGGCFYKQVEYLEKLSVDILVSDTTHTALIVSNLALVFQKDRDSNFPTITRGVMGKAVRVINSCLYKFNDSADVPAVCANVQSLLDVLLLCANESSIRGIECMPKNLFFTEGFLRRPMHVQRILISTGVANELLALNELSILLRKVTVKGCGKAVSFICIHQQLEEMGAKELTSNDLLTLYCLNPSDAVGKVEAKALITKLVSSGKLTHLEPLLLKAYMGQ